MALMASNIPENNISPSKIMAFWYGGEMGATFHGCSERVWGN
jgi:hypothetical protein